MSTLPALPRQGLQGFPSLVQKKPSPSPPIMQPHSAKIHLIRDRDVKDHHLQKNIKELSQEETAAYRNSHKQSICIDMLRRGYHKSFSELFSLIQKWNALRDAGGPGSAIWLQEPLEEQHEKLDQLQHFLTRAEAAQQAGYYAEVYKNQFALAQYFKKTEDYWLSNHFFECCFETAKQIKIDGGRKEAEAHANLGLVDEEYGQLEKAAEHYEAFYHLTVGRIWKDEAGRTHNSLSCENLWRIYTLLSERMLGNKEYQQAIKALIKAFDMAKEGGDKKLEGEAAYRLGVAHISSGNPQTAISSLTTYMEISKALGDNVGLGKANEAMAKALESQGKILESIEYLENFIEIAKSSNLCQSLAETCIYLGDIFNARGNYEKACQYFEQAYETAIRISAILLLEEAQVLYGIAKAHRMMLAVNSLVEAADNVSIQKLLAWKKNRSDVFSDPVKVDNLPFMEEKSSTHFEGGEENEVFLENTENCEQALTEKEALTELEMAS